MRTTPAIDRVVTRAADDPSVLAVLVFGSVARGEQGPTSDVDVCLVLRPEISEGMSEKRLEYLARSDLDIQIFQQLPLPIRRRVFKEGRVLLSKDDDALYGLAYRTAQAFEDSNRSMKAIWTRSSMLDRERVLARLDQMKSYLAELREIAPRSFEEYQKIETRRACERLLQVVIAAVIDVCSLLVSGLRLGLPGEEDDLFEKLEHAGIISGPMRQRLREMKGFRNLLMHEYGRVDDRIVYGIMQTRLGDFEEFERAVLLSLRKEGDPPRPPRITG